MPEKPDMPAMFCLDGRTALVTGASRGIGEAIATGLARAGANLVVASRSVGDLRKLAGEITGLGRACTVVEVDVADVGSVGRLYDTLATNGITPDILVNNAGTEQVCPSTDVDEDLWDRIVDTNLKGAFFVAQRFARPLLARKIPGSIINLGSLTSAVGIPTATAYTASKSGILGMTRALSTEWAGRGIRVNAIGPGYFRTDLTEPFYQDTEWQNQMLEKIPMARFGQLEDLVGVSVFLASPASSYVTGQIIYVDGGTLAAL